MSSDEQRMVIRYSTSPDLFDSRRLMEPVMNTTSLKTRWLSELGQQTKAQVLQLITENKNWATALVGFERTDEIPDNSDLRGIDLSGNDLKGADLTHADLSRCP